MPTPLRRLKISSIKVCNLILLSILPRRSNSCSAYEDLDNLDTDVLRIRGSEILHGLGFTKVMMKKVCDLVLFPCL